MNTLPNALEERKDNLHTHLDLAQAMELHLVDGAPMLIGATTLSVGHLLTIKSALIIHLYNIVEAIMTRTIEEVGIAVKLESPVKWSNNTLREWLRSYASIDGGQENRLNLFQDAALKLLTKESIGTAAFKKPTGSWHDKQIHVFSKRLNVSFPLTPSIARKIQRSVRYGDKTPLEFLADRRNAIAHGRRTFENGANDLTMKDIRDLADVTIEYMEHAATAFQNYLDNKKYLAGIV